MNKLFKQVMWDLFECCMEATAVVGVVVIFVWLAGRVLQVL